MNRDARQPVERAFRQYQRDLEAFLNKFFPWSIETSGGEPTVVFAEPVEEFVASAAEMMARRMLTRVDATNVNTWRAAARQSLHGKQIYQALKAEMGSGVGTRFDELLRANVQLLRRLPARLEARAQAYVAREQLRGTRAATIQKTLEKQLPQLTRSQATMLARTAVGRAETALTRTRAERLGLDWYEWATSEDQRVRPSHKEMDHVLVAWTDPPSPEQLIGEPSTLGHYHPGVAWYCRCLALPLIDLDEVRWPHKVYAHGHIEYVNRAQFERWIRVPSAA
jgi:SPP1 gp7 family putative phage head morphogenesis protein